MKTRGAQWASTQIRNQPTLSKGRFASGRTQVLGSQGLPSLLCCLATSRLPPELRTLFPGHLFLGPDLFEVPRPHNETLTPDNLSQDSVTKAET